MTMTVAENTLNVVSTPYYNSPGNLETVPKQKTNVAPWKEKINDLQTEQGERYLHPMDETQARNIELLKKFMEIFDAHASDQKELLSQSFLPKSWKTSCETALPLHTIAFLADDVALKKLQPLLEIKDVNINCPYKSSLLHVMFEGYGKKAWVGSPEKCLEIFLQMSPSLKSKKDYWDRTATELADCFESNTQHTENPHREVLRQVIKQLKI